MKHTRLISAKLKVGVYSRLPHGTMECKTNTNILPVGYILLYGYRPQLNMERYRKILDKTSRYNVNMVTYAW